ncbi:MAG: hypothetical protein KDA80_07310, partial [Planctomycetaceae bacterium]|nr:hypothetical protein [Planctomycetaceae bacterium]
IGKHRNRLSDFGIRWEKASRNGNVKVGKLLGVGSLRRPLAISRGKKFVDSQSVTGWIDQLAEGNDAAAGQLWRHISCGCMSLRG